MGIKEISTFLKYGYDIHKLTCISDICKKEQDNINHI